MKTKIITLLLCITISTTICAQDSDYKLIEQTVSYYLDGGTNNDFDTLKKAFHKNATMKFISNGEYTEVNAIEAFRKGIKPGPKQNRKTSIVSIDITGMAASAKLKLEYPNGTFIDYMNLLKIDGEWKVVSKIFHRKTKTEKK
ncbi:nuclear transport factor 2 family protein [Costertonia aggregata]|uniref:Nuclear transport factor 2 family protein n=1 Tax=Costertonia aggregata TaxID=343403 RepID=A0A7H9AU25_9FLAO|nr:nuclear transport factor 2 family protein [Costertonia aggregata]QLG46978.1 nuclear transport factor 2 family protein [Costertonia aggregata]